MVSESLLEVGKLFKIALLVHLGALHILLTQDHTFLHECLFKLVAKSEALFNIDSKFNLYFLRFRHLYISFELLNKSILFLDFKFEVSIVLFELTYDEALREMSIL